MTSPHSTPRTLTAAQSDIIQRFRDFLAAERAQASDVEAMRNIAAIGLRHFVHPGNVDIAFDLMAMAAEAAGDELAPTGVWEAGAKGEQWLPHAIASRAARSAPAAAPYTPPAELLERARVALAAATSDELHAADRAYSTYCRATGGRSAVTGADLPPFASCTVLVRAGWLAVARDSLPPEEMGIGC